jgi:hypothetical protein
MDHPTIDFWKGVIFEIIDNPSLLVPFIPLFFSFRIYAFLLKIPFYGTRRRKPVVIAFAGNVGCGKDTAANFLPHAHRLAFAEPLKKAAKILFNFTDAQLYDEVEKERIDERWGETPREILQWLGTDILRKRYPGFFINHMKMRIEEAIKNGVTLVAVTDCRFKDEAESIRKLFEEEAESIKKGAGFVVKITRPGAPRTKHNKHESENGIPDSLANYFVRNCSVSSETPPDIKDSKEEEDISIKTEEFTSKRQKYKERQNTMKAYKQAITAVYDEIRYGVPCVNNDVIKKKN